ncbi:HRSL1 enzyme, partial [Certhia familiaris]|nr:HRSL1 enzyme [Certhia familiaris]
LIEFKRRAFQHWALYLGDGNVIHVTAIGKAGAAWQDAEGVLGCSRIPMSLQAQVKIEPLNKVAEDCNWCVNNKYDRYRIPFPTEEIVQRAEPWVDIEVSYDLLGQNCEHFVTMLRYGEGVSDQVSDT